MTQMRTIDTDYFTIIEDAHMTPVHLRARAIHTHTATDDRPRAGMVLALPQRRA